MAGPLSQQTKDCKVKHDRHYIESIYLYRIDIEGTEPDYRPIIPSLCRWLARILVILPLLLIGLLLTAVAAWGVDKLVHTDQVNRNVTVVGVPVGGFDPEELDSVLDEMAAQTATDVVVVRAEGLEITVTNAEAGVTIDTAAMRTAILEAGRETNPVSAFSTWVGGAARSS